MFCNYLGQIIEFKGLLLGIYNAPNLFQREYVGVIIWQNNSVTKIRQDFWKNEEYIPLRADEYDFDYHNGAIVYSHYNLHET